MPISSEKHSVYHLPDHPQFRPTFCEPGNCLVRPGVILHISPVAFLPYTMSLRSLQILIDHLAIGKYLLRFC